MSTQAVEQAQQLFTNLGQFAETLEKLMQNSHSDDETERLFETLLSTYRLKDTITYLLP